MAPCIFGVNAPYARWSLLAARVRVVLWNWVLGGRGSGILCCGQHAQTGWLDMWRSVWWFCGRSVRQWTPSPWRSAQEILLLSGKLKKGRRNCLRMMRNERRKMKVMERSRKSERQNKDQEDCNNYAHIHVFMLCFMLMFLWILVFTSSLVLDVSSFSGMVSNVNCISPRIRNTKCKLLIFWMLQSDFVLSSSTQSVSQILAHFSSRKQVFWGVVLHPPSVTGDRRLLWTIYLWLNRMNSWIHFLSNSVNNGSWFCLNS